MVGGLMKDKKSKTPVWKAGVFFVKPYLEIADCVNSVCGKGEA